jgi:hypothetical protein
MSQVFFPLTFITFDQVERLQAATFFLPLAREDSRRGIVRFYQSSSANVALAQQDVVPPHQRRGIAKLETYLPGKKTLDFHPGDEHNTWHVFCSNHLPARLRLPQRSGDKRD